MVRYIVGTDGDAASSAICDYLEGRVTEDDRIRAVYASTTETEGARQALETIAERLGSRAQTDVDIVDPGREGGPTNVLVEEAERFDADQMIIGLRRHSRTERIIMGSVSHSLIENVTIPLLLVPLPEYQPTES